MFNKNSIELEIVNEKLNSHKDLKIADILAKKGDATYSDSSFIILKFLNNEKDNFEIFDLIGSRKTIPNKLRNFENLKDNWSVYRIVKDDVGVEVDMNYLKN